ncbi:hypothetical protein ABL78_3678 [Leptomonas seymouri]|uniref:Uncharacterized protein n=1 Tax=Leptomonas seymouri TaxID=5684 RepID=A0A0N1PEJ6_LEPSE|nr:hypothetical protein ABL78_3678 [Leptomonas seymouri]|eukprot:KPI87241.1 hypothetical protein ABL78_3678 [Leptomonas seymouri]
MRSETNNEWAEDPSADPQRPGGSDAGRYTDNSQSVSHPPTHSHSRDGSGGRVTVAYTNDGAPRSGRGQRPSGFRVPDASPPPRLPAKYAAQVTAATTPRGAPAGRHNEVSGSSASPAVYEDDDDGYDDGDEEDGSLEFGEREWECEEDGEWDDVDEDDNEEEEEEQDGSDRGARALQFDSEEGDAGSCQPAAFVTATSISTAASANPFERTVTAKGEQLKPAFDFPVTTNAFRRATPKARAGYSVGYTPAEDASSEDTSRASPPRNTECGPAASQAFGGHTTPAWGFGSPSFFNAAGSASAAAAGPKDAAAAPGSIKANLFARPALAGHEKPVFGSTSTPSLPFQRSTPAVEPSAGATVFGPRLPLCDASSKPNFGVPPAGAAGFGKADTNSASPLSAMQSTEPHGSSTAPVTASVFSAPAATAPAAGGGGLPHPAIPAPSAASLFARPFQASPPVSTERKPNFSPPSSQAPTAATAATFAGFGVTPATTAFKDTATAQASVAGTAGRADVAHKAPLTLCTAQPMAPHQTEAQRAAEGAAAAMQLPAKSASAASRAFTSLAHNSTSAAAKNREGGTSLEFSKALQGGPTLPSSVLLQRPILETVEVKPQSPSQQSSSMDYSTLVASPRIDQHDEDGEDDEGKDEAEMGAFNAALAADSAGDATMMNVGSSRCHAVNPNDAATRLSAVTAVGGKRVVPKPAGMAASGRSKAVEDILSAIKDANAANDILNSACEREEHRAWPFSGASSAFSPLLDSGVVSYVGRLQDTLMDENTVAAAEMPATQLCTGRVKLPAPPPASMKVFITHVYNCSQGDMGWLAEPRDRTRVPFTAEGSAPPRSSSSPSSLEVALYCRPLLVHLPDPPLHTSLLRAAGQSRGLRTSVKVLYFVCGSLLPALVRILLHLIVSMGLLVLCILVVDGVWREFPAVGVWVEQVSRILLCLSWRDVQMNDGGAVGVE